MVVRGLRLVRFSRDVDEVYKGVVEALPHVGGSTALLVRHLEAAEIRPEVT